MNGKALTGLGLAMSLALATTAGAGVIKTKTKSNQSNDRVLQSDVSASLAAEFDRLDGNKDGQLDGSEMSGLIVSGSPGGSETTRGAPLKGVDVKIGNGAAVRLVHVPFSADLDRDGNGLVSRAEWLTDGQAQFDLADNDHDGALNAAEATKFGWNVKTTEVR